MSRIPCGNFCSYSIPFDVVTDYEFWAEHSTNQQARIILFSLLGNTIFAYLGNHCYFYHLFNLIELDRLKDLNSRIHAYSTLICGMRVGTK